MVGLTEKHGNRVKIQIEDESHYISELMEMAFKIRNNEELFEMLSETPRICGGV